MAAATIHSDFGAQENKICHCFHFFTIYLPWSNGNWMLWSSFFESFKQAFSLSSFTHIKRLFSFFSLSATRVISSTYLRLLIFLPAILIPGCDSSSPKFHVMYSAYVLNEQNDNIKPCRNPDSILNQSTASCLVLTIASWPAYRFLRIQVRWPDILTSLRILHRLLWSTQSKPLAQSMKQMFFWIPLLFLCFNRCWQFDLWFLYLF